MVPHVREPAGVEDRIIAAAAALAGVLAFTTGLIRPNGTETAIGLLLVLFGVRVGLLDRWLRQP